MGNYFSYSDLVKMIDTIQDYSDQYVLCNGQKIDSIIFEEPDEFVESIKETLEKYEHKRNR